MKLRFLTLVIRLGLLGAFGVTAQPLIFQQPEPFQAVFNGVEPVAFTVKASGASPLSYQWLHNDAVLTGRTSATFSILKVAPEHAGTYTVRVTDVSGTVTSAKSVLIVDTPLVLIPLNQRWRFNDSGSNLGERWKESDYEDSAWSEAEAPFVSEPANLPIPKTTPLKMTNALGAPVNTHYFRTRFQNPTEADRARSLILTNFVDDGAVFYLNGVELARLRLPPGYPDVNARATVAPEGRGVRVWVPKGSLQLGENVLAVELHQNETNGARDGVFALTLSTTVQPVRMPDLVPWTRHLVPRFEEWTFKTEDCEVREGLVKAGKRRLLRFATETRNIGTTDLVMGAPVGNPEFVFHACHDHYHFQGYVTYRLVRTRDGSVVVDGGKPSFSLEDSERWDLEASPTGRFTSENSGIQRGWSDIYGHLVPGQWLDVTDVPSGRYRLVLDLDPDSKIPELNESNNSAAVDVFIPDVFPSCDQPPANDDFANAQIIPSRAASIQATTRCATRELREPRMPTDSSERPGGPSVWFRWTAPITGPITISTEGSNFDTLVALYRGQSLTQLERLAFDDESGTLSNSRLTTDVVAGTEYYIAVEGFYSFMARRADTGDLVLTFLSDAFAQPAVIEGNYGSVLANTLGATWERGEGWHRGMLGPALNGGSVWFAWTPSESGLVSFAIDGDLEQRNGLEAIQIYEGDELAALTPRGEDRFDRSGIATFQAEAGRLYRVVVAVESPGGVVGLRWDRTGLYLEPVGWREAGVQFDLHPDLASPNQGILEWQIEVSEDLLVWVPWNRIRSPSPYRIPNVQRFTAATQGGIRRYFRAQSQ